MSVLFLRRRELPAADVEAEEGDVMALRLVVSVRQIRDAVSSRGDAIHELVLDPIEVQFEPRPASGREG